jgi:hypothetical protein
MGIEMVGGSNGAFAGEFSFAPDATVEDVLQGASLELDQLGLRIDQLRGVLAVYVESLAPELRAQGGREFQGLDLVGRRLHALAGVVGLLGPRGGVDEALAGLYPVGAGAVTR